MDPSRRLSDETWARIKRAYYETDETVLKIAGRFGIARSTIQYRMTKESWPARLPSGRDIDPPPRVDDAPPPVVDEETAVRAHELRAAEPHVPLTALERADQLYRLIDLQLESLELDMTRKKNVSTQDQERRARAVTMLLANLDHVRETVADLFKTDAKDGARKDAEQKRQEIAERLERLAGEETPRS